MKERALARDIDKSDFLWKRLDRIETPYKYSIFKSFRRGRVFIVVEEFEEVMYDCKNVDSYFFDDCYVLIQQPLMNACSCNPLLDHKVAFLKRNIANLPFRNNVYNVVCTYKEKFNTENIRKSIETWWKSVSRPDKDPLLFYSSSSEPFKDVDNPYIQINLNYFEGRTYLENKTYKIFSHLKLLHTGKMIN